MCSAILACPVDDSLLGRQPPDGGAVRVIGVCIPWAQAHVSSGLTPNRKPWEDHLAYLGAVLTDIVAADRSERLVVVGDFNDALHRSPRLPRRLGPLCWRPWVPWPWRPLGRWPASTLR